MAYCTVVKSPVKMKNVTGTVGTFTGAVATFAVDIRMLCKSSEAPVIVLTVVRGWRLKTLHRDWEEWLTVLHGRFHTAPEHGLSGPRMGLGLVFGKLTKYVCIFLGPHGCILQRSQCVPFLVSLSHCQYENLDVELLLVSVSVQFPFKFCMNIFH